MDSGLFYWRRSDVKCEAFRLINEALFRGKYGRAIDVLKIIESTESEAFCPLCGASASSET